MIIVVRTLYIIFIVLSCLLTARYNLHMLQLNGYKNREHIVWLRKNAKKQIILAVAFVAWLAAILLPNIVTAVVNVCLLLEITGYYYSLRKRKVKKKLVYTKRMQRLIATDFLLSCICFAILVACRVWYWHVTALLQPLIILCANLLNKPIEKKINNSFIRDAKRILEQSKDLIIIGVTGSYGKTSFKNFLQTMLQPKYNVLITPESYNTPMGVVRTIREQLRPTHEVFVCEMGARYVGDIKEVCDIVNPAYGVITSVGPQHLETFLSIENVTKTKFELADAVKEKDGIMFFNGDNQYINEHSSNYENGIFFSVKEGIGYHAKDINVTHTGTRFTVVTPQGESAEIDLKLVGEYNIINVLGAIAVAHYMGVSLNEIKIAARKIQPVAHRMQMIPRGNVTIIDDAYNSNPVGSKAAVETLALFEGVRILITPGMVELGEAEDSYNYKFGTYAAASCDYIFLIGKEHTRPIYSGALDAGFDKSRCLTFDDLETALKSAYDIGTDKHKYILLENDLPDNY